MIGVERRQVDLLVRTLRMSGYVGLSRLEEVGIRPSPEILIERIKAISGQSPL